ncbi:MAG TPA: hypothetical protein VLI90_00405 [Tepidisphaeraceae bacterium]|nr:hypothetical protein [Tepidisphaeraceae bacterium]
MRVFGDVLAAFGWLGLICFCVVLLMFLLTPYDHHPPAPSDIADCFVFALVCFIWSALWRMIGSLAIAVRDIARNSFGR